MIRRVATILLIILVLMVAIVSPAYAIDDPDTPPAVNAVYVYENLLETGDTGVLIDYYLDYDPVPGIPDEVVTESYLTVFYDTISTTQFKSVSPYAFVDSGYGRGLAWIYFSASEVTALGIDSANIADYEIWLVGNPTLAWAGDPPKTTAIIDVWNTVSNPSTLLGLRVLYYADILELAWTVDMVEATAIGNRLTTLGESYFDNVIANLRTMAPSVYSASEFEPTREDIDYTTEFGAILTDGTGTAAGSPITLASGNNNVNVTADGTFTLELLRGTVGTATSDTVTIVGSPVALVAGTNTITTNAGAPGNIVVAVALVDTQTDITDTVTGTALDLSELAARFGMSTMMFSGLVWLAISVIICGAAYRVSTQAGYTGGGGKAVMLIFNVCIIGGAVLGLMSVLVAALMFIAFGTFTAYIVFFRGANV